MKEIRLSNKEIAYLKDFVKKEGKSARKLARANILLLANEGKSVKEIIDITGASDTKILNVKKRYREEGLQSALKERPRSGRRKKYTAEQEAEIVAMASTPPPPGRKRWTIRLLAQEARKNPGFKTINHEMIRLILKRAKVSLD
jgi:transposase